MNPEVKFIPEHKQIRVRPNTSVLDASRKARVQIRTRCGGKAACLMCKIKVIGDPSGLTPPNRNEQLKLGAALLEQDMRLSCQARVIGHAIIEVPEDPLRAAVRRQLAQQQEEEGI